MHLIGTSAWYNYGFATSSFAYLNKFPNPYAPHVMSCDTIDQYVDNEGRLRITKLVVKKGNLPSFMKPFLGDNLHSWIIEKSIIDPIHQHMVCYSANVDHRKFIQIEEYLNYQSFGKSTNIECKVQIASNFIGFKQKIEDWCRDKFKASMANSQNGLMYVMKKFEQ